MLFNLLNPPPMVTPHGVPMSARACRLYGYLNHNGCCLTTFSTDDHVESQVKKIQAAKEAAEVYLMEEEDPGMVDILSTLIRDIDTILGRRPSARV